MVLFHFTTIYASDNNTTRAAENLKKNKIIIDLSKQKLFIYQEGKEKKLLLESKASTGRWGHETTRGKFKVLLKERKHLSNLYPVHEDGTKGGASMPYTVKFTSSGIAIHAGNVPDYPDSHGCIRVPYGKAMQIFKLIDIDSPVEVVGTTDYSDKVNQFRMTIKEEELSQGASVNSNFGVGYLEDDEYDTVVWVEKSLEYLDGM